MERPAGNTGQTPPTATAAPRTLSGRRRLIFFPVLAVATYVLAELIALGGLHIVRDGFTLEKFHRDQLAMAGGHSVSDGAAEVIHPYLGWVMNPQIARPETVFGIEIPVNHLGFRDDGTSLRKRTPNTFIVGIFGGSVAWHVSTGGLKILKERLSSHPGVAGREIEIVRLAMPGYKQPQQVMALNYVHVLGGEFDAVVNIDGYNEVALSAAENAAVNTAIDYPRAWHARSVSALDPRSFAAADRLLRLRGQRQSMAASISQSRFRWSPIFNLVWYIRDEYAASQLTDLGMEVLRTRKESFVNHGPANDFDGEAERNQAIVNLWRRSSVQLQRICAASKTIYLHVLQPNQYLEDSKVLSDDEQLLAYDPTQQSALSIRDIYPLLRQQAEPLRQAGVHFSDQTMLFSDVTDTIYCDPFCHYNKVGVELLTQAVTDELCRLIDVPAEPSR